MRVAALTQYVHDAGGVEAYLQHVLAALADRGHQVAVWHEFKPPPGRRQFVVDGTPVRCIDAGNVPGAVASLSAWKPDVVFLNGLSSPAAELQFTAATPTVVFLHGYHGTCISGTKTRMFPTATPCSRPLGPGCLLQYFPRRCGGWSPVSMIEAFQLQRLRQGLLGRVAFVATFSSHMRDEAIANGVHPDRAVHLPMFAPSAESPAGRIHELFEREAQPRGWHLTFLGRMERLKGAHLLVEALSLLDPALRSKLRVTFAGDGRERPRLEAAASRVTGVATHFTGWISPEDRRELLTTTDLLVVPSVWPEPLGLVGIEAGAAGVPVVAFDVGGVREWLKDGVNGRVIDTLPPSATGLAAAIRDCLSDPRRLRTWSEAAIAHTQQHAAAAHVAALEALLQNAAAGAARSA